MKNKVKVSGQWFKNRKARKQAAKLSVYGRQFADLKRDILDTIEEHYGPRCLAKDTDDFPEMLEPPYANNDKEWGRCPVCLVYEKFDKFWGALYHEDN